MWRKKLLSDLARLWDQVRSEKVGMESREKPDRCSVDELGQQRARHLDQADGPTTNARPNTSAAKTCPGVSRRTPGRPRRVHPARRTNPFSSVLHCKSVSSPESDVTARASVDQPGRKRRKRRELQHKRGTRERQRACLLAIPRHRNRWISRNVANKGVADTNDSSCASDKRCNSRVSVLAKTTSQTVVPVKAPWTARLKLCGGCIVSATVS